MEKKDVIIGQRHKKDSHIVIVKAGTFERIIENVSKAVINFPKVAIEIIGKSKNKDPEAIQAKTASRDTKFTTVHVDYLAIFQSILSGGSPTAEPIGPKLPPVQQNAKKVGEIIEKTTKGAQQAEAIIQQGKKAVDDAKDYFNKTAEATENAVDNSTTKVDNSRQQKITLRVSDNDKPAVMTENLMGAESLGFPRKDTVVDNTKKNIKLIDSISNKRDAKKTKDYFGEN